MNRLNALTLYETQRLASQLRSIGPNNSLSRSHRCIRGEDLAKQAAASSTKGVVGKSGNTIPTAPSNRDSKPRTVQRCKSGYQRPWGVPLVTHGPAIVQAETIAPHFHVLFRDIPYILYITHPTSCCILIPCLSKTVRNELCTLRVHCPHGYNWELIADGLHWHSV
jgi:hypothetical protein